jgi:copper homeostasis protein
MTGGTNATLEVIACSVADAVEAERGGARRLEVISSFELGGLTPPTRLVGDILAAVGIPVRVMLRESEGYTVTGEAEAERLCAAARQFSKLRVEGLVLGFLRDGEVDDGLMERLLSCAPNLKATFHHAFEEAEDQSLATRTLKSHRQVDRILTAGGEGDWPQKIARLASCEREAGPRITVLAGGGLNGPRIRSIREATNIREFHVGRAARAPATPEGAVRAELVRELARAAEAITDTGR